MVAAVKFLDRKYGNIPQSENGIRKLVSGKYIKWCSTVGSSIYIFGVSLVGIWSRIPLIKSSHKLTRILFIILNSKLGIWLCSQPRIDLNSQYNFYDILTRPYKYLSNTLPTISTRTTCTQHNLHVSFTRCWNLIPDSLDQVESQIDSNTIYYFEFQTWNLALQPA